LNIDPFKLTHGEPVEVHLVPSHKLTIKPEFHVERLPFRSNAFYFTHDFWLSKNTLLFQVTKKIVQLKNYTHAIENVLFKAEFDPMSSSAVVTRITPEDFSFQNCVLTHDKKSIVFNKENKIFIYKLAEREFTKSFSVDLPSHYMMGMLSLTSDDKYLMYEVNLDWFDPESCKKAKTSTYITLQDIKTGFIKEIGHLRWPWIWTHVLPNPKNPKQITSALIKYDKELGRTKESKQRLWLWEIDEDKPMVPRLLYKHKKKGFTKKTEIVTHECWCMNGEHLTFIVRRKTIKLVKINTREDRVIMDKGPNPWHCDGSNPEWIVFDTTNKDTGIWISDTRNEQLIHLCRQASLMSNQNMHPHPFFSPDLSHVYFNSVVNEQEYLHRVKTPF